MRSAKSILMTALTLTSAVGSGACGDAPSRETLTLEPLYDDTPIAGMAGRPFVVSPDGRHLAFSVSTVAPDASATVAEIGAGELEAVRVLDLVTDEVFAPAVERTALRLLNGGHTPVPTVRCWDPAEEVFYMGTTARSWLELDLDRPEPAWRPTPSGSRKPDCPDRALFRTPFQVGDFEITSTEGGGLRVEHVAERRVVFESDEPLLRKHRLRDVALAPTGRRIVVVYTAALGSFTGSERSVLVTVEPSGDSEVRLLEPALSYAEWGPDGNELIGYGRVPDSRDHGLYRTRIGP